MSYAQEFLPYKFRRKLNASLNHFLSALDEIVAKAIRRLSHRQQNSSDATTLQSSTGMLRKALQSHCCRSCSWLRSGCIRGRTEADAGRQKSLRSARPTQNDGISRTPDNAAACSILQWLLERGPGFMHRVPVIWP